MNDVTRLPDVTGKDLVASLEERNETRERFRVLRNVIWPGAKSNRMVLMAMDYCKARGLDPMKRVVHIVSYWSKDEQRHIENLWPGIAELRTTAMRTQAYAGRDDIIFGPDLEKMVGNTKITFPEWAQCVVYRYVQGHRHTFVGDRVYWLEAYASKSKYDATPNDMWTRRPRGQLCKVAEANALRIAFPEEAGADYTAEEMEGQELAETGVRLDIEGEFETDAQTLARQLEHQASTHLPPIMGNGARTPEPVQTRTQTEPPRTQTEKARPTRGQQLADFLALLEAADSLEAVRALEDALEELPTGGGTRKSARVAWEQRLQDLQPDAGPATDEDTWVTLQEIEIRLDQVDTMDELAEVEDLIGELSSAENRVEAARLVRERAAQLNEREVTDV